MNRLAMQFSKDYQGLLGHYTIAEQIELTEHLIKQVGHIIAFEQTKDNGHFKQFSELGTELLKKYRSRLTHYDNAQMYKYFVDFRVVLIEKDIITSEESDTMLPGTQGLSPEEVQFFLSGCTRQLEGSLHFLLLKDDNQDMGATPSDTTMVTDEADTNMTRARQLLAVFYMLKASFDIEHRGSVGVSDSAYFAHLLTGTKVTTLQNSDIYKKFLLMPNYRHGLKLIEDLKFIKPYFSKMNMEKAIEMIDAEIKRAFDNDLNSLEQKKYLRDNDGQVF
jgi:hypothetical protein